MAAEELGNVGKAPAGDILTSRKVYIVTLVQPSPGAPAGFEELYNAYWAAVEQQVSQLEAKAGVVMRIFAEGVIGRGDDAMLMVQQSNPAAHSFAQRRISAGAVFEELEDTDLFGQVIDWGRCLQSGLINRNVADTIQAHYTEAADKRIAHMEQRLSQGILESEAAVLLTGDQNIALPDGVERFIVSPPELDELSRWVEEANKAIQQQMAEEQARAAAGEPPSAPGPAYQANSGSRLWTPGS
ncbi:MAG: hypothetical protein O2921_05930 [Chloroflexi bacterium]|jgi:hypothetical protein|nr:hypothetical protein [Chloroflexota bacterium]MDA1282148.1 hypothetical protein [Chloroflexota bacterium]